MSHKLFCSIIQDKSVCLINGKLFGTFSKLVVKDIKFPIYNSSDLPVLQWDKIIKEPINGQVYSNGAWSDIDFDVVWSTYQPWFLILVLVLLFLGLLMLTLMTESGQNIFKRLVTATKISENQETQEPQQQAITFVDETQERAITFVGEIQEENRQRVHVQEIQEENRQSVQVQDPEVRRCNDDVSQVLAPVRPVAPTPPAAWTTAVKWSSGNN